MIDDKTRKKAHDLVEKAKKKGLIKTYDEFCKMKEADEYAVSNEEIICYTSVKEGETK